MATAALPAGAGLLGSDIATSAGAAADQDRQWSREVLHGRYAGDGCAWAGRYAECNDVGAADPRVARVGKEQAQLRSELEALLAKRREALLAGRFPDDETMLRIGLLRQEISETPPEPGAAAAEPKPQVRRAADAATASRVR